MNYVIGSGPSGVGAALGLLERKEPVTILDVGLSLEADIKTRLQTMRRQSADQWDPAFIDSVRKKSHPTLAGLPLKHVFGSDYHVRALEDDLAVPRGKPRYSRSMAKGGLSNVWGGAVLPYSDDDLRAWPVKPKDMEASVRAVLKAMPVFGGQDDLEEFFPSYGTLRELPLGSQSTALYADLKLHRAELRNAQIYFGKARVALQDGCVFCGLCMHGCPHDVIYSTRHTLRQMEASPGFKYEGGVIVERIEEGGGGVKIIGRRAAGGERVEFQGKKAFLACGVINTLKIVLASIGAHGQYVPVRTSQHFILPMLRPRDGHDVISEQLQTLSQIFIEVFDKAAPEKNCHLQIYSYNDFYRTLMKEKTGPFYPLLRGFWERVMLPKVLIAQGYLSSAVSPTLEAWLNKETDKLHIDSKENPATKENIRRVVKRLKSFGPAIHLCALDWLMKLSEPGVGAHIGASFPMSARPSGMETDILGRLPGRSALHIVDASVFTDIPPSTVTLPAMANAHRIASQA